MTELTCVDYRYKTTPFVHQHKTFLASRNETAWGYLMEQGTGKSKVAIDKSAYLYGKGLIDCVIIQAPNGVHTNWTLNEFPIHCPLAPEMQVSAHWTGSTPRKKDREAIEELFNVGRMGLRIFSINMEAMQQTKGKGVLLVEKLLRCFRCHYIVDESSRIKTPGAKVTKNTLRLGKQAHYRSILSGTPNPQSPFDLYSQFKFLDPDILWYPSFQSFKHHYAEFEQGYNHNTKKNYDILVSYKNLPELKNKIQNHSTRVLKRDCLDLPDKVFITRTIHMSKQQKKHYESMDVDLKVEMAEGSITVKEAIVRMIRLQQILGGHIPLVVGTKEIIHETPIGEMIEMQEIVELTPIDEVNYRMKEMLSYLEEVQGKVIIWARFTSEVEMIANALTEVYGKQSVVTYYGATTTEERQQAVDEFQNIGRDPEDQKITFEKQSKVQFFVANQAAAGIGITLTQAEYCIYYSNSFNLEHRLQSEDRAHRIGQKKNVTYLDFEVPETIDTQLLDSLVRKRGTMEEVLGDESQDWISRILNSSQDLDEKEPETVEPQNEQLPSFMDHPY